MGVKKYLKEGIKLQKKGKFPEAYAKYLEAVKIEPKNKEAWLAIGRLFKTGRDKQKGPTENELHKALDAYMKVLEIDPEDGNAWRDFAVICYNLNMWNKAVNAFSKAMELKAEFDIEAWKTLAKCRETLEDWMGAAEAHKKALEFSPDDTEILLAIGNDYLKQNMYEEAVRWFERVLKIEPEKNYSALFLLGIALCYLEKFDEAAPNLKKAIKLRPGLAASWEKLGLVYKNTDKLPEALYCYKKAAEIGDIEALNMVKELESQGIVPKKPNGL